MRGPFRSFSILMTAYQGIICVLNCCGVLHVEILLKTLKDKIIFACLNLGITDMIKIEEALNKVVDANESLFA